MFGFGKGQRKGNNQRRHHGHCAHKNGAGSIYLTEAEIGKKYVIMNNPDVKTMEMGLYHSGIITVHKNESDNPNIVIGVGESRYIIPRELASKIIVR